MTIPLLVQLVLVLTSALLLGRLAALFKIPPVVGEIAAGILLGPTFLGGSATAILRMNLAKPALLVFLFVAGLETNFPTNRAETRRVLTVSLFGLVVPFLMAWTLATAVPTLFGSDGNHPWFPLFLGTALSISALPVIARIFMDLKLEHSALAGTVLSAAAIDDLAGWALFALLLGKYKSGDAFSTTVFGTFFAGALFVRWRSTTAAKLLRVVAMTLCAPFYFASIGLQLDLRHNFSFLLAAVLLVIACAGKIFGATLGARISGSPWRNALGVGCAMNARGAMEIILATVALQQGIINPPLHTGLVFVALATSLMAGPCLNALRL